MLNDGTLRLTWKCTYGPGPLSEGCIIGDAMECNFHSGVFDIRTGEVLTPFGVIPLRTYPVTISLGRVESAGVVAEMQRPGRLNAGKDALPLNARLGASGARARLVRMIIHATPA